MTDHPIPYWMALAHAKQFSNKRKMDFLIAAVLQEESLITSLQKVKSGDRLGFDFTVKEWEGLQESITEIPNHAFLAEKLIDQGIRILHVMEADAYPALLKENLKKEAPILIYCKGNTELFKKGCIAIVGSRLSSKKSLDFTNAMARRAVEEEKVIVSGFAKGVDKQALDSALAFHGHSIIVLPQGISTYQAKVYYASIIKGDLLVISSYHPQAPWSTGLAMDRNKIIYGLSHEIFVAESSDSGGTWEGAILGIKRGRKVYVRMASQDEDNANNLLIYKGGVPVDMEGKIVDTATDSSWQVYKSDMHPILPQLIAREPAVEETDEKPGVMTDGDIISKTISALESRPGKKLTIKEIIAYLGISPAQETRINKLLSAHPSLEKAMKGKARCFYLRDQAPKQGKLF